MNYSKNLLIITASDGENLKLAQRFLSLSEELVEKSELLDLTTLNFPIFTQKQHVEVGIPSWEDTTRGVSQSVLVLLTRLLRILCTSHIASP